MKLSQFKENIKEKVYIIKTNFKYSFIEDIENFGSDWTSLASTIFYNLTFILFIRVIYAKVNMIAGYTLDEMMVLILVGEITIIIINFWISASTSDLQEMIWSGSLDLILNKPLPTLWYLTFRKFNIYDFVRNGFPPVIMVAFLVNWQNLHFSIINVIIGILICFIGQVVLGNILFVISCFSGFFDKKGVTILADQVIDDLGRRIPVDGYHPVLKSVFLSLLPIGIAMGLATSVILGKFDPYWGLAISLASLFFTLTLKILYWKYCLLNYSSASS